MMSLFSKQREKDALLDVLEEIHTEANITADFAAMFLSDISFALSTGDSTTFEVDLYKLQGELELNIKNMRAISKEALKRIQTLQAKDPK